MEILKKIFDEYSLKAKFVPTVLFVLLLNIIYVIYYQEALFSVPPNTFHFSLQTVVSLSLIFLLSSIIPRQNRTVI